jgi:hypothetical protein
MKRLLLIACAILATPWAPAQTRIASDFELQQMERQVSRSTDFLSQLSGHLNIGDLRLTRNDTALARAEYARALDIASNERLEARRASSLTRYATATSYAALAAAKLGDGAGAYALSEEAIRYTSDSAKSWNLYANAMSALGKPAKAVSASRNAVAIASREPDKLDLAIYQYSLASSLLELNQSAEAEKLLSDVVTALRSDAFAPLRREVAKTESFEIYSSARGEQTAYISILNRSQLRLARLYEDRGEVARAREQYANALAGRSDDPTALAALARLGRSAEERERYYAQAFDANPFSLPLIRDYQRFLSVGAGPPAGTGPAEGPVPTPGAEVRLALQQMQRGELVAASATVDTVLQKFPNNDTLQLLRHEIEQRRTAGPVVLRPQPEAADLRAIMASFNQNRLTADQRSQLDRMAFTSVAIFNDGPPFETGRIEGVAFRFSEPMTFNGVFPAHVPLRLTYRILGPTQQNGADALLLEPIRLEAAR